MLSGLFKNYVDYQLGEKEANGLRLLAFQTYKSLVSGPNPLVTSFYSLLHIQDKS
jgi:hypothetical protein